MQIQKVVLLVATLIAFFSKIVLMERCTRTNCLPPNCRCSDWATPGNLLPAETPQFVFLTFDNHVNLSNIQPVNEVLNKVRDRHGCRLRMTFFVSHSHNDYALVNQLYKVGSEIAVHTITHPRMKNYTTQQLADEILGQRDMLQKFAQIPKSALKGLRTPFLELASDRQYNLMRQSGFSYDFSQMEWNSTKIWPYTMDFESTQSCLHQNCSNGGHPGLWQLPMISWTGDDGQACWMPDSKYCKR